MMIEDGECGSEYRIETARVRSGTFVIYCICEIENGDCVWSAVVGW